MSSEPSTPTGRGRGRGRGRSRGGFGKYLRARGRRGAGRPAEFHERLLLEGEKPEEEEKEEEEAAAAARTAKYSRRQLGTNADRYAEPEPELGSDGEPIAEPEVDLSSFLERQRLSDEKGVASGVEPTEQEEDEDDVDHTLDHITSGANAIRQKPVQKKGKVQTLEWDDELESMAREKAAAEATRDLKDRFRAKSEKLRRRPIPRTRDRQEGDTMIEAPALPTDAPSKDQKTEMQDFLDDLLG